MGGIIAIDYGQKRTEIVATDILQTIANGVAIAPSREAVKYLSDYILREPVDLFVVGLPKQMNNESPEDMKYVGTFATHLKRAIPSIPVTYYDGRFTSILTHKAVLEDGLKKEKR